jgi:transposase
MTHMGVPPGHDPPSQGGIMSFQRTIGIDLAIRGDHVAQIFDNGRAVGRPIRFRHTAESLEAFISVALANLPPDAEVRAVMEPTGMSWFPVASRLERAGVKPIRVKGKRVKALRRYLSEHAKTDASDAHVLGALPHFGGPALDPVYVPGPARHALQRLTKQRERYQADTTSGKRRLIDLIRWACPALEAALPDLMTRLSLALLAEWFDPRQVLAARPRTLAAFISRNASGNHPHSGAFVEALVRNLRTAAEQTLALHGDRVDFELLQLEVAQEVARLRLLEGHMAVLERRIEALYAELLPGDALRTIPGIGRHLGPIVLGVLHDAGRFRSQRHARGFCGLFPTRSESGGQSKPGQRLTKSGNDRIKKALYLAADTARRIDPGLAEVYWRLMVRKGHHHKQALCAVATRLVNRIHSVLKSGRPYVLRDADGRTIDVAEGKRIIAERFSVPDEIRKARRRQAQIAA